MTRLFLLAATLGIGAPAIAETVAGQASDDLSIQSMHNYSACVADNMHKGAVELLTLDERLPETEKKTRRLAQGAGDHCAPSMRARFSGLLFRGGLAERLLVKSRDGASFTSGVAYDPGKAPLDAHNVLERTAVCVVRAEPAKTWAIFQTAPTSREELSALQAIGPSLINCVPAEKKMKINRQGVRAILALSAYHLLQLTPAGATGQS